MARQFVRSQRKAKLWAAIPSFETTAGADGTIAIAFLSFVTPQTVIRMLGEYNISADVAPVAKDRVKITVGLAKVSTDAATLGATALPDPAGDVAFPWLYWAEHSFYFPEASLTEHRVSEVRQPFDIRSMRKFTAGESLIFIFQYADISGAPVIRFMGSQTRVLTTLH